MLGYLLYTLGALVERVSFNDHLGFIVNDVIVRPYSRCDGVSGCSSAGSDDTYVSGRSFRMHSTSVTTVCSSVRLTNALPSTFLKQVFVSPINLSHQPLYQGALFGMNFQVVPWKANLSFAALVSLLIILAEAT